MTRTAFCVGRVWLAGVNSRKRVDGKHVHLLFEYGAASFGHERVEFVSACVSRHKKPVIGYSNSGPTTSALMKKKKHNNNTDSYSRVSQADRVKKKKKMNQN